MANLYRIKTECLSFQISEKLKIYSYPKHNYELMLQRTFFENQTAFKNVFFDGT